MNLNHLAAGALAIAALVAAGPARADDLIRLGNTGDVSAPTLDLKARPADLNADVELAWYRGGWGGYRTWGGGYGWGGGYRGWGVGYRGWGWGGGYYGGFYPRYNVGFYPSYGFAYYPSFSYSYYPSFAYYGGYFPCSLGADVVVTTTQAVPAMPRIIENPAQRQLPMPLPGQPPVMPRSEGTFDYDGGPKTPVPMPKTEGELSARAPTDAPRRPMIVNELLVSDPAAKSGKWVYPAYGETPRRQR